MAPVARYQPRYARLLGRWLLQVAANANLFYPDTLPTNMQSSAAWVQQTGVESISYEGVRNLGVSTPYATGDANAPVEDLNPYGAWGSGWMAALFQTSIVPAILQIDCVATEAFPPAVYPTRLLYNPYDAAKTITAVPPEGSNQLYDAVSGTFTTTNITIPPDNAVVVSMFPDAGVLSQAGTRLLVNGIIIDYWNGARDADGDGLPDWWESRYFGTVTNAQPSALAANGFSNLQCYWLGLDPTNPNSNFRTQVRIHPGTSYPRFRGTPSAEKLIL